jgi:four helix bundle protein
MGCFKDLKAYQLSFDLAMEIFRISKVFPVSEQHSLTSQVIRTSRSVCSNIAESYRKHRYPLHFISKLTDADMENTETLVWIDFAKRCGYIDQATSLKLEQKSGEIGKLLAYMINNPIKFCDKPK